MTILYQVKAPHFCAGLIVDETRVIDAAPILRWSMGKTRKYLKDYFERKGWKVAFVKKLS